MQSEFGEICFEALIPPWLMLITESAIIAGHPLKLGCPELMQNGYNSYTNHLYMIIKLLARMIPS